MANLQNKPLYNKECRECHVHVRNFILIPKGNLYLDSQLALTKSSSWFPISNNGLGFKKNTKIKCLANQNFPQVNAELTSIYKNL